MISKQDLLAKIPGYITAQQLLNEIEQYMIAAAERGEHNITYFFPDKTPKDSADEVYMVLGREGYKFEGGYVSITVKW